MRRIVILIGVIINHDVVQYFDPDSHLKMFFIPIDCPFLLRILHAELKNSPLSRSFLKMVWRGAFGHEARCRTLNIIIRMIAIGPIRVRHWAGMHREAPSAEPVTLLSPRSPEFLVKEYKFEKANVSHASLTTCCVNSGNIIKIRFTASQPKTRVFNSALSVSSSAFMWTTQSHKR